MSRIGRITYFKLIALAVAISFLLNPPLRALSSSNAPARIDESKLCPTIRVECPETGQTHFVFTAIIEGLQENQKITYQWSVWNGEIVSGQGTASITVAVHPDKHSVNASINIGGLDPSCESRASCSVTWTPRPLARLFDHYKKLPYNQEEERLDKFARALRNEPSSMGYIIAYGKDNVRARRAEIYLEKKQSIDPARVISLRAKRKGNSIVELYIVPVGAKPPELNLKGEMKRP